MAYLRELKVTYQRTRVDDDLLNKSVENAEHVFSLFKDMQDETKEKVVVLHLNPQLEILSYEVASIGSAYQNLMEPVEIFRGAILARAHSIIVAHNHPSGNPQPSGDDTDVARKLHELGVIHKISLQDFIIIGYESFFSYEEQGYFSSFPGYNKYSP